jgi:chromate transporter
MQKNIMLFKWFIKFGLITPRDDYSVHDYIKEKFCPEYMQEEEFDEKEQLLRDTPGPVGIKYAYFVGSKVNGTIGALFAVLATFLPVLIITSALFYAYPQIAAVEARIPIINGVHPAALGLIAAQVYKIAYFNKIKYRKSVLIILPAAALFLFLPGITGIGLPTEDGVAGTTLMPFFIAGIIIAGLILGFVHDRADKLSASRPQKYIDPRSRKGKKMIARKLREEEYELQKYRSEEELKKVKEQIKEKMRIKKYNDND